MGEGFRLAGSPSAARLGAAAGNLAYRRIALFFCQLTCLAECMEGLRLAVLRSVARPGATASNFAYRLSTCRRCDHRAVHPPPLFVLVLPKSAGLRSAARLGEAADGFVCARTALL